MFVYEHRGSASELQNLCSWVDVREGRGTPSFPGMKVGCCSLYLELALSLGVFVAAGYSAKLDKAGTGKVLRALLMRK